MRARVDAAGGPLCLVSDPGAGLGALTTPLAAAGGSRAHHGTPPRVGAAVVTIRPYPMSLKTERHLARPLTEAARHPDRAVRSVTRAARRVGPHPRSRWRPWRRMRGGRSPRC